ncbi:unnamed protein product [Echinostoma caproni]|uniref:Uncharacterized protein n=1 Tax=Echinostoma caproni TaxID=27848 RepID=A0A3P8LB18_9TREM|nr:unnamed protein product [Echinostoma caproni]
MEPVAALMSRKRSDSPSGRSGTTEPPVKQMRGARDSNASNPSAGGLTYTIDLPGASTDDVHPLVSSRRPSSKSLNTDANKHGGAGGAGSGHPSSVSYNGGPRKAGTRQRDRNKSRK